MARKSKPITPTSPLALQRIDGNLTFSKGEVWAWFSIPTTRWPFRADSDRLNLITSLSNRLTLLAGRQVHLRVTTKPYPAAAWAEQLHERTPNPLGGQLGSEWREYLRTAQKHVQNSTTAEKAVYLGVLLSQRAATAGLSERILRRPTGREMDAVRRDAALVAEIVAGPGLAGRPATVAEVEFLVRRSIALCMPVGRLSPVDGQPWDEGDIAELTERVHVTTAPFAATSKMERLDYGAPLTRHVAVLTIGRVEEIEVPERARHPWLVHLDSLPFPVEWSMRLDVLGGADAAADVQRKLLVIRDMQNHYREHDLDEPLALERQARQARQVEDDMTTGGEIGSARVHGHFRVAVYGDTEEECLERARRITEAYRDRHVTVVHPKKASGGVAQAALLEEFVPNGPRAGTSFVRRLPVMYVAAGFPGGTSSVGDRRGPYLGYTVSSARQAVMFDTHFSTEVRETSGLVPIVGALGSGKSVLMGAITYNAVCRGIPSVLLDPSGPMARMCELPELRDFSRHIDLTQAPDGTLNPYGVVPQPRRQDFPTVEAHETAATIAAQDRKILALDVVQMLLPPDVAADGEVRMLLSEAVRATNGAPHTSLWAVVEHLEGGVSEDGDARMARRVAAYLRDMAKMPLARLFFPQASAGTALVNDPHTLLTVLTMPGLVLPPRDVAREHWSTSERLALPLLHLAAWYATRAIYGRTMHERKLIALDEVHFLADWSAGRSLFTRLGRDSRKWNACVLAASQNPGDVLGMEVSNFIATSFVGRIEDEQIAADALRMLRVQTGIGYESVLAGLSARDGDGRSGLREFVMRDVDGRVDRVCIDLTHLPNLLAALDTTAAPLASLRAVEVPV